MRCYRVVCVVRFVSCFHQSAHVRAPSPRKLRLTISMLLLALYCRRLTERGFGQCAACCRRYLRSPLLAWYVDLIAWCFPPPPCGILPETWRPMSNKECYNGIFPYKTSNMQASGGSYHSRRMLHRKQRRPENKRGNEPPPKERRFSSPFLRK